MATLLGLVLAFAFAAAQSLPVGSRIRVQVRLCTLEAPSASEPSLLALAKRAPAILSGLEAHLGCRPAAPYRMILIPPGPSTDREIFLLEATAPPWAAGFFLPGPRIGAIRIAQASRYPYGTLESVLAHEASHALLADAAAGRLPRWFEEGVATREGRRWSLEDALVFSSVLLTTDLPSLDELEGAFQASESEARMAYAGSFAFVTWASRRYGEAFVRNVVRGARQRSFAAAWQAASGARLEESERQWRREGLLRYRWLPLLTASSTVLWLGISLLALVAGAHRRARARAVRASWKEDEEGEWVADEDQGGDVESVLPPEEPDPGR
ncbi:MAG TPA: hypothetical protein VGK93_10955 [Candidatus Eisenbacteria bacterium]